RPSHLRAPQFHQSAAVPSTGGTCGDAIVAASPPPGGLFGIASERSPAGCEGQRVGAAMLLSASGCEQLHSGHGPLNRSPAWTSGIGGRYGGRPAGSGEPWRSWTRHRSTCSWISFGPSSRGPGYHDETSDLCATLSNHLAGSYSRPVQNAAP